MLCLSAKKSGRVLTSPSTKIITEQTKQAAIAQEVLWVFFAWWCVLNICNSQALQDNLHYDKGESEHNQVFNLTRKMTIRLESTTVALLGHHVWWLQPQFLPLNKRVEPVASQKRKVTAFLHPDVDLTSRYSLLSCKSINHLIKPCTSLLKVTSTMQQLLHVCRGDIQPRLSLSRFLIQHSSSFSWRYHFHPNKVLQEHSTSVFLQRLFFWSNWT